MSELSAVAASAAGVAVLGRDERAVDDVVALARGDVGGLRDAQELVRSLAIDPSAQARALRVVEQAIERIEARPAYRRGGPARGSRSTRSPG